MDHGIPLFTYPLKVGCGQQMEHIYTGDVPFFIYPGAVRKSYWESLFHVYSYSPFSSLVLQLDIRLDQRCSFFTYFPCMYFLEYRNWYEKEIPVRKRQPKIPEKDDFLNARFKSSTTILDYYAVTQKAESNISYCMIQPVFPGNLLQCEFGIGQDFMQRFSIRYIAPDTGANNCPAYMHYAVIDNDYSKIPVASIVKLSNESAIHNVQGRRLWVRFHQGCLWRGAKFFIEKTLIDTNDTFLNTTSRNIKFACDPQSYFKFPNPEGKYAVKCMRSLARHSDYVSMNFTSACQEGSIGMNILIGEARGVSIPNIFTFLVLFHIFANCVTFSGLVKQILPVIYTMFAVVRKTPCYCKAT